MPASNRYRISLFLAGFLGFSAISQPGYCIWHYAPIQTAPSQTYAGPGTSIQWPTNSINLSQLQQILSQNPGVGQFNIQFPNQVNWPVSSDNIQSLAGNIQQEAQSMGVLGKLPDLSFSSLAGAAQGLNQISIPSLLQGQGNLQSQVDNIMQQLRYQELNLSSALPDWLKNIIVAIYDATYAAVSYVQLQMLSLVKTLFG